MGNMNLSVANLININLIIDVILLLVDNVYSVLPRKDCLL